MAYGNQNSCTEKALVKEWGNVRAFLGLLSVNDEVSLSIGVWDITALVEWLIFQVDGNCIQLSGLWPRMKSGNK